jgi:hypothetical protein
MPTDYILPRHMALFVIDNHVYYNTELTILEKLEQAVLWEHTGPHYTASEGNGRRWSEEKIRKIFTLSRLGLRIYLMRVSPANVDVSAPLSVTLEWLTDI